MMTLAAVTATGDLWRRFTGTEAAPSAWMVVATGLVVLAAVLSPRVWPRVRYAVTIAHEGGHAVAALATGRRLRGIRLHSDTSGVTLSKGPPRGPGMVLTAAAGYVTPSLLGLGGAVLLAFHHAAALLWAALALLAAMLLEIRNVFGAVAVVVTGVVVFIAGVAAPSAIQVTFAYLITWFLLIAGVRPVFELDRARRNHRQPQSDADQLAWLTGLPASVWVGVFALVTVGAAIGGMRLIAP